MATRRIGSFASLFTNFGKGDDMLKNYSYGLIAAGFTSTFAAWLDGAWYWLSLSLKKDKYRIMSGPGFKFDEGYEQSFSSKFSDTFFIFKKFCL